MSVITFFAPGIPKGQPRPRAFAMGGKARVFDPGTAEGWKAQVALAAKPHLPATPITGPVSAILTFWMPRPKSHYRTGKRAGELREDAPLQFIGKPDADNLAKAVLDALTTIGMWKDDAQVYNLIVTKLYGDEPGVRVSVADLS